MTKVEVNDFTSVDIEVGDTFVAETNSRWREAFEFRVVSIGHKAEKRNWGAWSSPDYFDGGTGGRHIIAEPTSATYLPKTFKRLSEVVDNPDYAEELAAYEALPKPTPYGTRRPKEKITRFTGRYLVPFSTIKTVGNDEILKELIRDRVSELDSMRRRSARKAADKIRREAFVQAGIEVSEYDNTVRHTVKDLLYRVTMLKSDDIIRLSEAEARANEREFELETNFERKDWAVIFIDKLDTTSYMDESGRSIATVIMHPTGGVKEVELL